MAEYQLEAVLTAVSEAMVGEGDALVVDLERLQNGLAASGIDCTATTNRPALVNELSFVREELRIQRTRAKHLEGEALAEVADLLDRLEVREAEIQELLWPRR